jgi:hypothetical protein
LWFNAVDDCGVMVRQIVLSGCGGKGFSCVDGDFDGFNFIGGC